MNWLTNFIRPKIRSFVTKKDVPDNLWHKCPSCEAMLFYRDLEKNLNVCYHCDHHMKLDLETRLQQLFDNGEYETIDLPKVPVDPLKFKDRKRYADRLKDAQHKTGQQDALTIARGKMGGQNVVIAAMNFDFMGGSMGAAVGSGILKAAKVAVKEKAGFIVLSASGGARMQEGAISLMQMPRTVLGVSLVKQAGLPYIVLLTHPTTGGVSASFAMIGDIHVAEPGATIGFAGKRVIQETIREELPDDFQTSEYLLEHGMVDMVVHRRDLSNKLGLLLNLLMDKNAGSGSKTKKDDDKGKDTAPSSKSTETPEQALRSYQGQLDATQAQDNFIPPKQAKNGIFLEKVMTGNFYSRLGTSKIKIDPANNNMIVSPVPGGLLQHNKNNAAPEKTRSRAAG